MTPDDVEARLVESGLAEATAIVAPLDGGPAVCLRPNAAIYPASMIKVPIAAALGRSFSRGSVRPETVVEVEARALTPNDAPSPFALGYRTSLVACASAMVSASDNVATNVLIDALGRDVLTRECAALGLRGTAVRRKLSGSLPLIDDPEATGRNAHPAADAARLFAAIARDGDPAQAWLHAALRAQVWNDKLSRGWRPGDAFAHKTGDTDETSHDGGILTLPDGRRFVIVVYTTLPSSSETADRFAAFARQLRPLLEP